MAMNHPDPIMTEALPKRSYFLPAFLSLFLASLIACTSACNRKDRSSDSITLSYVLVRTDKTVLKGDEDLKSDVSNDEAMRALVDKLGKESGALSLRFEFGGGSAMEMQTRLIDGLVDGPLRTFLWNEKDVKLQSVVSYVRGEKDGDFVTYYSNGKTLWSGSWVSGKRSGRWLLKYRDQSLAIDSNFLNDQLHGTVVISDACGVEAAKGAYADGKPVSGSFLQDPWNLLGAAFIQPFVPESVPTQRMIFEGGELKATESIELVIRK